MGERGYKRTRSVPSGTIVVLNGTSSCGKSSLARALQSLMADAAQPYLHLSIDSFWEMLPRRYFEDVPALLTVETGYFRCIPVLAAGNNLIVDTVLQTDQRKAEVAALLHAHRAFLIGVHCPLEVTERRERSRGDRPVGQARAQFDRVHAHGVYDAEVDTSACSTEECARRIKEYLDSRAAPRAFGRLQRLLTGLAPCGGARRAAADAGLDGARL
jgi:chloramphenicol 3-O phosphotransferase